MVKVNDLKNAIGEIQKHYDKHVNNKYVKKFMMNVDLAPSIVQNMNLILGANFAYIDTIGAIEDLYSGIKAVCSFINEIRSKIIPDLNSYINMSLQASVSENEKILSQMAIKNYPMNIKLLADMTIKLFDMIYEYDSTTFKNEAAYKRLDTFSDIRKGVNDIKS
jgi:hypothetical protein